MKNIKISIIVPVYNLEKEIEKCIESILDQTYQNMEVIIVDDGSVDNSRNILEKISQLDTRVRLVFKENGGVTSARLEGIKIANGEYIGFVDGDDRIEPNMYEILVENALKYDADISHCGYQINFEDGRIRYFHNTGELSLQDNFEGLCELLNGNKIDPALWNKLFHRKLFDELDVLMDKSIKINEDLLMNYYLFNKCKLSVYEDKALYHYIARPMGVTKQKINLNMIFDPITVRKQIFDKCNDSLKIIVESVLLNTCIHTYCGLVKTDKEFSWAKKEVREEILRHIDCIALLSKRTKVLAKGIVRFPWIVDFLYPVYQKYFQKNPYKI